MSLEVFLNFVVKLHDFSQGDTCLRTRSKIKNVRSCWFLALPHAWVVSWQNAQQESERGSGHSPSLLNSVQEHQCRVKQGEDSVHPGQKHLVLTCQPGQQWQ